MNDTLEANREYHRKQGHLRRADTVPEEKGRGGRKEVWLTND